MARILAVDDDPSIIKLLEIKLKRSGYEVISAINGEEGYKRALEERPDLVLLDIMMPKMNGYEVCERLKSTMGKDSPAIVMLSAKGQQSDMEKGFQMGADDYVVKPFDLKALVERINAVLIRTGKI
ncbi:MAG: response regulator [Chloroflexi bacterium]|nr:response regulator [Chloroflexota bacterium]MBU1747498.1 response regulator [Chloroflexota bacterium]MBU1878048.1 response regulator [Chloroflexota bacterium]